MRMGAAAWCGLLAAASALAGCGGSVHKSSPPPSPKPVVAASRAPQLIAMRRIDGATWQTVVVRTDGTGDVAIFIGERGGNTDKDFRLGGRELGQLERLAAVARRTPEKAYFGTPAPSTVYIIYVQRHILQVGTGHEPRQLRGLTGILSGLIDQYA
ncbi:MAG: hypothetical protein JO027_17950 [Solirubrobacterales bacterium]|nr:hypothetical protein [Solirubrobacterales bacterium]